MNDGRDVRFRVQDLTALAANLFEGVGLARGRALAMARVFVEADCLGFTTHGLQRVPDNLEWLDKGQTRADGEPRVLSDRTAVFAWDAEFLPGPWVVTRAFEQARKRVRDTGIVAATLRRCTHTACLGAYLPPLLEEGLVGLMVVSTPDERFVSPFGGREAVFSNNPMAFCAPASGAPLLFDVSMAITAGGQVARARREGRRLPEACLKTASGEVTDDPGAMDAERSGTMMPVGGLGHGHKGYALTLMTEVLTQGLGGHGRSRARGEGEANSVFIEVIDPRAFGDWRDYLRETDHLLDACLAAQPDDPDEPVRVPGQRAWRRREQALAEGLTLYPGIFEAIEPWARRLGVALPEPVTKR